MTKVIQICASQNDLFGLDDRGDVFQYNFKVKTWMKLVVERNLEEERPGTGARNANGGAALLFGEPTRPSKLRGPSWAGIA